ncbi:MAG: hypothetical protein EXS25_09390 [Pedosphaera sp.]|nr:hypothetical protein [Pedosphaera sp.]
MRPFIFFSFLLIWHHSVGAWDYELHRFVNQIALKTLPDSFPAFVRTTEAAERIAYLSGEPDRWRNSNEGALKHVNETDHFFNIEDLESLGLRLDELTGFREEFVASIVTARMQKSALFELNWASMGPNRNRWVPGLLPWKLAEEYGRLKSGFSCLKTFEQHGGQTLEIVNAQASVVQVMGVMGHFAGDAAQPLHTTRHYNGWVGLNPSRYTTNRTFHAWIDGGFIRKSGLDKEAILRRVRPARLLWKSSNPSDIEPVFSLTLNFVREQFTQVDVFYSAEKSGALKGAGTAVGRNLMETQLLKAGQFLGDLWYSAWILAPKDFFLQSALARRKLAESEK